jgi:hypothetical protein
MGERVQGEEAREKSRRIRESTTATWPRISVTRREETGDPVRNAVVAFFADEWDFKFS